MSRFDLFTYSRPFLNDSNDSNHHQATPAKQAGKDTGFLSPEYLTKVSEFMTFFTKQSREQATVANALDKKITDTKGRIEALTREIRESSRANTKHERRSATIALQATSTGKAVLQLAYVVSGASWASSYDCRVDGAAASIQLSYYGRITNSTGEDWVDVRLFLSTATPSVGGEPPVLEAATVSFYSHRQTPRRSERRMSATMDERMRVQQVSVMQTEDEEAGAAGSGAPPPAPPMAVLTSKSSDSAASSTFEIPRQATILADNQEHKVTITVVPSLSARLTYTIVPRLSEFAFLKASTTNTSGMPLLEGPVNIFIDSNFVATSSLKFTAAGEDFAFFLGADKQVKVEYKPPASVKDEKGILKKSTVEKYTGMITVKNNKPRDISVVVYEQLPKSDDEQIKVAVQQPDLKAKEVTLNPKNNIEWRVPIATGKTATFQLAFTVEFPKDKTVTFNWG